ncbi:hypothetical protein BASA62_009411 [Batrachochytrium salamandrivorans]|nr:hypothetical protein BASA62_009411 [Batrachochytrium salamandrivorans]
MTRPHLPAAVLAAAPMLFIREWVLLGLLIFGGCCSNVYTLELLVRSAPTSGNLITFVQFLLVSVEGLISNLEFTPTSQVGSPAGRDDSSWIATWRFPLRLRPRVIPLQKWLLIVAFFLGVSVLNNYALGFSISMPVHIIFRSASLWVSMLMSWIMFRTIYSRNQIVGAVCVTIGMVLATLREGITSINGSAGHSESTNVEGNQSAMSAEWIVGIALLSIAIFLSCFLGQLQQSTYQEYGQQWREGLFYTHVLGLPAFIFLYKDLWSQILVYSESPLVSIGDSIAPWLPGVISRTLWETLGGNLLRQIYIPELWLYLLGNVATQYICISGVHKLSSMASAVSLHLSVNSYPSFSQSSFSKTYLPYKTGLELYWFSSEH